MTSRRGGRTGPGGSGSAWRCKYCGATFAEKANLAQHKRDNHWEQMSYASERSSVRSGAQPPAVQRPAPRGRGRPPRQAVAPPPPLTPSSPSRTRTELTQSAEASSEGDGEEEQPPPPTSPGRGRAQRKSPARKNIKTTGKNMPLPIGKKRKVVDPRTGAEVEEWIRNPKFAGA